MAFPLILSTGASSVLHFIDRMFLTWYSPEAIAAAMPGGILNFTVMSFTYSEYFKQNVKIFEALDFIAELTQHIPPKGVQLIRRYGLYSSRIKGRWSEMTHVVERAPSGWKASHAVATDYPEELGFEPLSELETVEIGADCRKQAWARLLAKVYEVDPLVCPKCGSEMKVIAIIQETEEIRRILGHLVKIGRSPPGFDPVSLNERTPRSRRIVLRQYCATSVGHIRTVGAFRAGNRSCATYETPNTTIGQPVGPRYAPGSRENASKGSLLSAFAIPATITFPTSRYPRHPQSHLSDRPSGTRTGASLLQPALIRCPKPRRRRDDANQVIGREHLPHVIENTAFPDSNLSTRRAEVRI